MSAAPSMLTVLDARDRTARRYDRDARTWAAEMFMETLGIGDAGAADAPALSLPLHPPTERQALDSGRTARAWVDEWRGLPETPGRVVEWERRQWSRVGSQLVPVRLRLEGCDAIASFAERTRHWQLLSRRMEQLARRVRCAWEPTLASCDPDELRAAVRRCAGAYAELSEGDWNMLLLVLDWLAAHPDETCYVRQLPIRGIDTKWLEAHRAAVYPLVEALAGARPAFAKAPAQVRIRFLDARLAPGGLTDLKAPAGELACLPAVPDTAIICENLVNMLALPQAEGTVAIHGGGYAVSGLASISWLARTRILYWGDLDSNGFAILNELRASFPHAESVMMDVPTLQAHRDLCVTESTPNRGAFERLTPAERAALDLLLADDPPARLEQERIEWAYALDRLGLAAR